MKVLHICTEDTKGAGTCAYRIHKNMQSQGIDSKMLVLKKIHDDDSVFAPYKFRYFFYHLLHKILRLCSIYLFEFDKLIKQSNNHKSLFTSPKGFIDITNNPLIEWADIIHLHWVDMFMDQPSFFEKVKKPVVWTLHDEGLFYGTSHYHDTILDDEFERKYRKVKINMVQNAFNLGVVLLSKHFMDTFCNDPILKNTKVSVINNAVDYTKFKPIEKLKARLDLDIPQDFIVFVFIAANIADAHKGLDILIQAIESFNDNHMLILAIGGKDGYIEHPLVKSVGKVYDTEKLSELISTADYFAMPSLQEAFSQVPIEAMACGKPAVVFPVSGTEELITVNNGVRCCGFKPEDLVEGIKLAMSRHYDGEAIREDVIDRFSPDVITRKYMDFYKEMIGN